MERKGEVKGRETLCSGPVLLDHDGSFTTVEQNLSFGKTMDVVGSESESPQKAGGGEEGSSLSSGLFSLKAYITRAAIASMFLSVSPESQIKTFPRHVNKRSQFLIFQMKGLLSMGHTLNQYYVSSFGKKQ